MSRLQLSPMLRLRYWLRLRCILALCAIGEFAQRHNLHGLYFRVMSAQRRMGWRYEQ